MVGVSVFAHELRHLMDCRVKKDCLIADVFTTLFMKCSFPMIFILAQEIPFVICSQWVRLGCGPLVFV